MENKEKETVMGIDYGNRNIGLALGRDGYVTPLKIIAGAHTMTAIHEIIRMGMENKVSRYVVGLPITDTGKETKQSIENRKFGKMLRILSKKPVVYFNEYASTQEASAQQAYFGHSDSRRSLSDHVAAAIILKRFFDESPKHVSS
jgi:putative holliday junction resolvase